MVLSKILSVCSWKALNNLTFCIVLKNGIKKEILKYKVIDEEKLTIIPFGANISDPKIKSPPPKKYAAKKILSFVGKDQNTKALKLQFQLSKN